MKKIVILTSSLFTERALLYSTFFDTLENCEMIIEVWTTSYPTNKLLFEKKGILVREFPTVTNFRERFNYLRTINNLAWANKLNATSILSMGRFNYKKFSLKNKLRRNLLLFFAILINVFKLESSFENYLLNLLLMQSRSKEACKRFKIIEPDLVVSTNPFWYHESAIAIEAKRLGIKIYSYVPSWDNISTKSRFVFKSDFYGVWSEIRKNELIKYYPYASKSHIDCIGAPQYDVFFDKKYSTEKSIFLSKNNLKNDLPIVLYVLGSPLFLKSEVQTCIDFVNFVISNDAIFNFQLLIRPHPNKDNNELVELLENKHPNIKIQSYNNAGLNTEKRVQSENQIIDWISTFKYSDVLINLSSTSIFDSLYFEKSVININFDHTATNEYDFYIKEINSKWEHLKTVYDSNLIIYVDNLHDMNEKLKLVLSRISVLDITKSKDLLRIICNNSDGNSGQKFFASINNLI